MTRFLFATSLAALALGCAQPPAAPVDADRHTGGDAAAIRPERVRVQPLSSGRLAVSGDEGAVSGAATDVRVALVAFEGGYVQVQDTEVAPNGAFLAELGRVGMPLTRDLKVTIVPLSARRPIGALVVLSIEWPGPSGASAH